MKTKEGLSREEVENLFSGFDANSIPHPKTKSVFTKTVQTLCQISIWPAPTRDIKKAADQVTPQKTAVAVFDNLVTNVNSTTTSTSKRKFFGPGPALLSIIMAYTKQDITQKALNPKATKLDYRDIIVKTAVRLGPHPLLESLRYKADIDFSLFTRNDSSDLLHETIQTIQSDDQSLHGFLETVLDSIPLSDPLILVEATDIISRALPGGNIRKSREYISNIATGNIHLGNLGINISVDNKRFTLYDPDSTLTLAALVYAKQDKGENKDLFTKLAQDLFGEGHPWYNLITAKKEDTKIDEITQAGMITLKDLGELKEVLSKLKQSDPSAVVSVQRLIERGIQIDPEILASGINVISRINVIRGGSSTLNNQDAHKLVIDICNICSGAKVMEDCLPRVLRGTQQKFNRK